ncbi:hypothetical protein OC834_007897 [Tilletia horrida]|nr:hypothetical protein OC834_007897 [Tilletia horrida]
MAEQHALAFQKTAIAWTRAAFTVLVAILVTTFVLSIAANFVNEVITGIYDDIYERRTHRSFFDKICSNPGA